MTYRFIQGEARWKIDALRFDPLNRWQLRHLVNDAWLALGLFSSAKAAMAAVASGKTGVENWDSSPHNPAEFTTVKWSFEGW